MEKQGNFNTPQDNPIVDPEPQLGMMQINANLITMAE
jgi:hypothetical protein